MVSMYFRKIVSISLLFSMAFAMAHEITFSLVEVDHCTVQEYAKEITQPVEKGDICDIHFEYHHAFLLPASTKLFVQLEQKQLYFLYENLNSYNFFNFLKPPIS